jgi:hypothetical protein
VHCGSRPFWLASLEGLEPVHARKEFFIEIYRPHNDVQDVTADRATLQFCPVANFPGLMFRTVQE